MKFLFILIIAATFATTLSLPTVLHDYLNLYGVGANFADRIGATINRGFDFGGDIAQGSIDAARDYATLGLNTGVSIGKGITSTVTGVVVSGFKTFDTITRSVILTIKNAVSILTNRIITRAAEQVRAQLEIIHNKGSEVFAYSEQKLADVQQKLDNEIQKEEDKLTMWADQKVQESNDAELSDESKTEITEIVDKIVESWNKESHECIDGILQPLQELNDEIRDTFEESLPIYEDLTNKIEECASGDQKNSVSASNCVKEIRAKLGELAGLPGKYTKLLSRVIRVSINNIQKAPCVVKVIAKTKRDQIQADIKIKELILQSKINTTTESATEPDEDNKTTEAQITTEVETATTEAVTEGTTEASEQATTEAQTSTDESVIATTESEPSPTEAESATGANESESGTTEVSEEATTEEQTSTDESVVGSTE